ncbi:MAG: response regulator [Xenococcaceae cyanobacterium MO_188.B29]|nr:response regulator [Xenococcaceae cyanobacterium MO_188.B29]
MQPTLTNPNKPLLVVEDSDQDFVFLRKILTKLAINNPVYRCTDGDEAINFLYSQGDYDSTFVPRPAVILLDLHLPGTDGKEVLKKVKQDERLKTIPIVVFTTSSDPQDINCCYEYGANGYMLKPTDLANLKKTIQVFVDNWLEVSVLPR